MIPLPAANVAIPLHGKMIPLPSAEAIMSAAQSADCSKDNVAIPPVSSLADRFIIGNSDHSENKSSIKQVIESYDNDLIDIVA